MMLAGKRLSVKKLPRLQVGLGMSKKRNKKSKEKDSSSLARSLRYVEVEDDAEEIFKRFLEKDAFQSPLDDDEVEIGRQSHRSTPRKASKRSKRLNPVTIDLHGMTLDEARSHLESVIDQYRGDGKDVVLFRVVTGKGRHSGMDGGVLVREIYDYARQRFADRLVAIDEAPYEATWQGLPLRGYFDMKCRS